MAGASLSSQQNPDEVKQFCPTSANARGACSGCTLLFLYDDVISLPSLMFSEHEREDCGSSVFEEIKGSFHQKEAPAANLQLA